MRRHALLLASGFWLLACAATAAQQPAPAAPAPTPRPGQVTPQGQRPATPPVAPAPGNRVPVEPSGPPLGPPPGPPRAEVMAAQNVRIEVAITDSASPTKRTVSILTAEGRNGRVRSQRGNIVLNVDAHPQFVRDGRIQLNLTVEYMPESGPQMSLINESLGFLIADGKPTVVSQAADPTGDRKVSIEVTATIIK